MRSVWCVRSSSAPIRLLRYSLDSRWSSRLGCSLRISKTSGVCSRAVARGTAGMLGLSCYVTLQEAERRNQDKRSFPIVKPTGPKHTTPAPVFQPCSEPVRLSRMHRGGRGNGGSTESKLQPGRPRLLPLRKGGADHFRQQEHCTKQAPDHDTLVASDSFRSNCRLRVRIHQPPSWCRPGWPGTGHSIRDDT